MHQDFDNETEANKFRDAKRKEGLAASRFDYGQNRFRVRFYKPLDDRPIGFMQQSMSRQASELSADIEMLNEMKRIIRVTNGGIEDSDNMSQMVLVAKFLDKEGWFTSAASAIRFFDEGLTEQECNRIKVIVDEALQEYEDQWNNKED